MTRRKAEIEARANGEGPGPARRLEVAVVGHTDSCSQKIFNLVAGMRRADPANE